MFQRTAVLAAALVVALPGAAAGQGAPRTDPQVGSPSESVYGIPLEEARRDAAPDVVPGSAIRTENGVGSSTQVPGRRVERAEEPRRADPERRRERRRERRAEASEAAERLSGNPSTLATLALLGLVITIPVGGGVLIGRLVGRRARL